MENYYNTVAKIPALKAKKMPRGLEGLARSLVESGRFRVDTIVKQNFVRWDRPFEHINMMFSHREILDQNILPRTIDIMRSVLRHKYSKTILEKKVEEELVRLRHEVSKNIDVPHEEEMRLARVIVQSVEPPVIMLILAEGAEVFVSYSYSVGDMLDIQTWQEAGDSSGLQSTAQKGCSIFVSCGGNPLIPEKKVERPTDGFYALSRMVVIAGQELAHYSDIIRDGHKRGSRYSADLRHGRASEKARRGRLDDMANVMKFNNKIIGIGLLGVVGAERELKFFREHRRRSLAVFFSIITVYLHQAFFILRCKYHKFSFLKFFYRDEYIGTRIQIMLDDMLFNLHPSADAYKRKDPVEEEMIMCIEALARVQQQANKWGREITEIMYPNLYRLYYHEILPGCIAGVERISGKKFPEMFRMKYYNDQ